MNQITFDFSKVDPKAHETLIAHMTAIGYKIIEPTEVLAEEEPLTVPDMWGFHIPEGTTIDSLRNDIPMFDDHRENFTDKNFGISTLKCPKAVGFYDMGKEFGSCEAINTINKLASQTSRRFRAGTPLEALLFWLENRTRCPEWFTVLGKTWDDRVLNWNHIIPEFYLCNWAGNWSSDRQVFIVEDL
jgi:hypothetical protein